LPIKKVALCGGAGASLLKQAKQAGADLYLTGDVKYHEAQEAVKLGIVIADGGHFGTERSSMTVLLQRLQTASIERNWEVAWKEDRTSCDIFKHC
jgi:putative NIF3 family GTP cyclohydrolase 1 type 2